MTRATRERFMPQSIAYGRGFLDGRARAFRRGSMALAHVAGAIGLARRCGVGDDDIDVVLREFDLTFDRATGAPVAKLAPRPERDPAHYQAAPLSP